MLCSISRSVVLEDKKLKNNQNKISSILVSACLAGVKCCYDGADSYNSQLLEDLKNSELIICCPELLGGLSVPRTPCNIQGGDGNDVLLGKARVIGLDNKYYTEYYVNGAQKAQEIAFQYNVQKAYLKLKSPSCGCGQIYSPDGTYLIEGDGILTALLKQNGIEIFSL